MRFRIPSRRSVAVVASALALSGGLAACGGDDNDSTTSASASGGGGGKAMTLKFGYHTGEQTPIGQVWAWWMDEIEKRSNGSIKFDRYWDGTLVKGTDMIEALNDGRVDVTQVMPTLFTQQFPVTAVGELPFETSNSPALSETMREVSNADGPLREEWTKQKLIPLGWAIGSSSALTTKDPVETVADLKGKRIRGNDRQSRVLKAAGANVINMELGEVYGSLQRGLINGVYGVPFGFIGPLKYAEVAKNFTDTGMGAASVNALAVSEKLWGELSDDQKKVIEEVNLEVPAKVGEMDAKFDALSCDVVKEEGGKLFVFSDEEVAKLKAAGYQGVLDEWKKNLADKGVDADQFHTDYQAKLKAAEGKFPDYRTGVASCKETLAG